MQFRYDYVAGPVPMFPEGQIVENIRNITPASANFPETSCMMESKTD